MLEKANGGQLSAAIAALAHVSSDYVHFLDADDRALPNLVAEVSNVLFNRPVKMQSSEGRVSGPRCYGAVVSHHAVAVRQHAHSNGESISRLPRVISHVGQSVSA